MTARTRERRPDEQDGALKIADRRIAPHGITGPVVVSAPTCPVACSSGPERCPWKCPIALGDALAELVDELLQR